MLTREYLPGLGWTMQDATFRAYADPSASSSDWWRLMQTPRYSNVYGAADLDSAYGAIGKSGYATDPGYVSKLRGLVPVTPEQQAFLAARQQELQKAGAPEHLAELGARQSALETGWGSSAPNNNFYGIKAPQQVAQAGRPDIQQGLFAEAKPMAGQQAPQPMAPQQQMPPMGMPQMQPPGFWDKLAGSPAFNMGLGILASNTGNYGAAGPAIGRGALLGMQNAGSLQEGRAEQMYRQMQMQQAQMKYQKDLQDAAKVDAWVATLSPEDQQLAGIIGADKLAQFKLEQQKGMSPTADWSKDIRYEVDANGKWYQVQVSADSTVKRTPLPEGQRPMSIYSTDPALIQEQVGARERGTTEAKADVEFEQRYTDDMSQLDNARATIERLAKMPGRERAVGIGSMFKTLPGSKSADYEEKLSQVKGENFLAMVPKMRGMGSLSNAEGDAIRQAASDLSVRQSDEQHAWSIATLYANLNRGMDRMKTRKFLGKGQEVQAARDEEIRAAYQSLFGKPGQGSGTTNNWKIERVQ